MFEGKQEVPTESVIAELTALSKSRHFTPASQLIFATAVALISTNHARPVYRHAVRPGDYVVDRFGVEVQTSKPINEGDTLTVYVEEGGKAYARPDAEFQERFTPKG
ncbi:MAG: hypothetical protein J0I99_19755 [Devosia sp.]|uniref:hypothetical protein n=1 Tax=Devosia sp. TaxID=1871048 RepID=UPI001AC06A53|nr:hypothetical protein [Devosia sp.]MBN9317982.1 hypothetical protein [Devosia sp.]